MNRVLYKPTTQEYVLYCIHSVMDGYAVRSKLFNASGRLLTTVDLEVYADKVRAQSRVSTLAKLKVERKGMVSVPDGAVPAFVMCRFEDLNVKAVSNEELLAHVEQVKGERYVIFSDVSGIEDRFDLGVQYLASRTDFDYCLDVIDKFGEICTCFSHRFESVEKTEDSQRAAELSGDEPDVIVKDRCPDCKGSGTITACINYDRDCAGQTACLEDGFSCASKRLETETCDTCKGTGKKKNLEKGGSS